MNSPKRSRRGARRQRPAEPDIEQILIDAVKRFDGIMVRCSVLQAELQERLVNMMIDGMTKYGRD